MLVGHLAVGFAATRVAPRVSLGTFIFAAMLADILWGLFVLAGAWGSQDVNAVLRG